MVIRSWSSVVKEQLLRRKFLLQATFDRIDNKEISVDIQYPRTASTYCAKNDIKPVAPAAEKAIGVLDQDTSKWTVRYQEVAPPNLKYQLVAEVSANYVEVARLLLRFVEKVFRDEYPSYGASRFAFITSGRWARAAALACRALFPRPSFSLLGQAASVLVFCPLSSAWVAAPLRRRVRRSVASGHKSAVRAKQPTREVPDGGRRDRHAPGFDAPIDGLLRIKVPAGVSELRGHGSHSADELKISRFTDWCSRMCSR
ncbi:hypothetical protein MTO96_043025, partial [Rhipicephalus appendiculatus]